MKDVERLHASADGPHRSAALLGSLEKRPIHQIQLRQERQIGIRSGLIAIPVGIQIGSAAQDDTGSAGAQGRQVAIGLFGGDPLEVGFFGSSISLRKEQARRFEVTRIDGALSD